MVYIKSVKKMIIVSLLSLCIMTNTVYSDVHASSVVIGGVVLTAGEAFALLMATLGISATTVAVYQNRDALQTWGNDQLDSFCSWMAETDDVVWSAQQDVEQWALSVIDGGLSTSGDMWKKFKKWISSLYFNNKLEDYIIGPDYQYWKLESLSELVGFPVYWGIHFGNYNVPSKAWTELEKYDHYFGYLQNSNNNIWVNVVNGNATCTVNTASKTFAFSCGELYVNKMQINNGNCYIYSGELVSAEKVISFMDAKLGLCLSPNIKIVIDDTPYSEGEKVEYALNSAVASALETADNPDDIDIVGIGSQVGVQTYPLNLPSAEALPDALSDLSTGALTLEDFNKALGLALANLSNSTLITEDPDNEKPISDVTTEIPVDMKNFIVDGLAELFPFCLPFDFIDFVNVLCAEPQAPKIEFPIKYPAGISSWGTYMIEVDLSVFDSVAEIMRDIECLLFIVGLIVITRSYMIRG